MRAIAQRAEAGSRLSVVTVMPPIVGVSAPRLRASAERAIPHTSETRVSDEHRICPACGKSVHLLEFISGNRTKPTKRCRACRDKLTAKRPLGLQDALALEDLVRGRSPWWRYAGSADAPRLTFYGLTRRGLIDEKMVPTATGRAVAARNRREG